MIVLDTRLARFEIDRRLRAVDHHRRARWGRTDHTALHGPRRSRASLAATHRAP
jgi:hypothetical protein